MMRTEDSNTMADGRTSARIHSISPALRRQFKVFSTKPDHSARTIDLEVLDAVHRQQRDPVRPLDSQRGDRRRQAPNARRILGVRQRRSPQTRAGRRGRQRALRSIDLAGDRHGVCWYVSACSLT